MVSSHKVPLYLWHFVEFDLFTDSWAVDNEEDDRVYNPNGSAVAQNRGNEWPRSAYGSTQNGQAGVREAGESGKSPSRAEPVRMQGKLGGKIADGSPSKYSTGSRASRQSVGASPPNNPMFKIAMIAMICALCMLMKTSLFLSNKPLNLILCFFAAVYFLPAGDFFY